VCCIEAENALRYETLSLRDLGRFLGRAYCYEKTQLLEERAGIVNRVSCWRSSWWNERTSTGECFSLHQPTTIVGSMRCTDWRSPWIMCPVNLMMIRCRRFELSIEAVHDGNMPKSVSLHTGTSVKFYIHRFIININLMCSADHTYRGREHQKNSQSVVPRTS